MNSQQAFPAISDAHIIDKKIIHDAVHKVFSNELPRLFNDNEINFISTASHQHNRMMDIHYHRKIYSKQAN